MKKIILVIVTLSVAASLLAAPLRNVPQTLVQPNGDTLRCLASGDEFYNYLHDAEGYTIIKNPNTGYYVYAVRAGEDIAASEYIAGKVNPAQVGLEKQVLPSAQKVEEIVMLKRQQMMPPQRAGVAPPQNAPNKGTLNNLVVFIRFSDDTEAPFSAFDFYEKSFNADASSLKSYFYEVSYGALNLPSTFYPAPDNQTVLSYCDSHPRNYYLPYDANTNPSGYTNQGVREHELLKNAIEYIKNSVPATLDLDMNGDGNVDNVTFVIAGNPSAWNTLLWPHRWMLYSFNTSINGKKVYDYTLVLSGDFTRETLYHETFHALGAPDLYHASGGPAAVSYWDIMDDCYSLSVAQHMGAYMKYKYGKWIDEIPIVKKGKNTLYPLKTAATKNCFKVPIAGSNQFYVLEYRKKANSGFESALPGSGILVYRINDKFKGNFNYNGSTVFDEIYLFRPGGTTTTGGNFSKAPFCLEELREEFSPETDPRPFLSDGTYDDTNILISNITEAGDSISFNFRFYEELPVTAINITVPATVELGKQVAFSATVVPSNANIRTVKWELINGTGKARISGNYIIGEIPGTVTLKATAEDGSGVSASKQITVTGKMVSSIEITVDERLAFSSGEITLTATVLPEDATMRTPLWSVTNETGKATTLGNTLKLQGRGTVTLKAAATDGSGMSDSKTVKIVDVVSFEITVPDTVSLSTHNIPLTAKINPEGAINKTLEWELTNSTGYAVIDGDDLVLQRPGAIWLKATIAKDRELAGEKQIIIFRDKTPNSLKAYWPNGNGVDGLLEVESPDDIGLLEIYSLAGNKVKEMRTSGNTPFAQLSFAGLPRGLYIIRVWNSDKSKHDVTKVIW